jgi:carboxyl-terminal processing protease
MLHFVRSTAAAGCAIVLGVHAQPGAIFEQAWTLVRDEFYDPGLHGVDWEAVRSELLPRAEAATSAPQLSGVINDALDRLHASHTRHYHAGEAAFYELSDIFDPDRSTTYVGIGIATTVIDGRTFVADVYDGGPAEARLLPGDEIVSVAGEPWRDAASFEGLVGVSVPILVRRDGPGEEPAEVVVTPAPIQPHELFLRSIHESARTALRDGVTIAYLRVRSYSAPDYQQALMDHVVGDLAHADALVLDIRGGWGGARPAYMSLVNPVVPVMQSRPRGAEWRTFTDAWHKPLVLLIDGGSRSGKELLAYAYKKHGLATLVGERTAGAVLGGRLWRLDDGSLLYIAVSDVLVDGERLEGVGVEPDVTVARELTYSAGRDLQLEAALDEAARLVRQRDHVQDQ